ncbi:MAG: cytochrome o ubiquinol oxidase subunit IV [Candidatus Dasytiphilus stammeri]
MKSNIYYLNKYHIKTYLIGLIISIILTVIPFGLVINRNILPYTPVLILVLSCAILQIIIHLRYFLHIDFSREERWNLLTLIFSMIIIAIFVIGSLWIMWNLNYNMTY